MKARAVLAAAFAALAVAGLAACNSGASQPSVASCTKDIVAHPKAGPWPGCKGLSKADLWKATGAAMAQGAVG